MTADSDAEEEPKRRVGVPSIAFGLLLAVMTVFVLVGAVFGDSAESPPDVTVEDERAAASVSDGRGQSGCASSLRSPDTSEPLVQPPEDVTWSLVGTIAVPQSASAGPAVVEQSGIRRCFAHTRSGALLAAVNTYAWPDAGPHDPVGLVEHNVASGPGYDVALAEAEAQEARLDSGVVDSPESSTTIQLRGFRLMSYDGASALVELALQASKGGYLRQQIEVAWEGDDWRVRLQPDGRLQEPVQIPGLTGYITWVGA